MTTTTSSPQFDFHSDVRAFSGYDQSQYRDAGPRWGGAGPAAGADPSDRGLTAAPSQSSQYVQQPGGRQQYAPPVGTGPGGYQPRDDYFDGAGGLMSPATIDGRSEGGASGGRYGSGGSDVPTGRVGSYYQRDGKGDGYPDDGQAAAMAQSQYQVQQLQQQLQQQQQQLQQQQQQQQQQQPRMSVAEAMRAFDHPISHLTQQAPAQYQARSTGAAPPAASSVPSSTAPSAAAAAAVPSPAPAGPGFPPHQGPVVGVHERLADPSTFTGVYARRFEDGPAINHYSAHDRAPQYVGVVRNRGGVTCRSRSYLQFCAALCGGRARWGPLSRRSCLPTVPKHCPHHHCCLTSVAPSWGGAGAERFQWPRT